MKHASKWCPDCNRQVRAIGKTPNHILHFILGIFTAGIWWVFVWFPLCFFTVGNYRCPRCGKSLRFPSLSSRSARRPQEDEDYDFNFE